MVCRRDSGFLPLDESESVSGDGPEFAIYGYGYRSDYWKIDLVISGHDHGGQVVIPFKGGLYGGDQGWFPPYVHGLYRTGRIRLFVTSGLSSEKQKLPRWNNRPEIAVLNVH